MNEEERRSYHEAANKIAERARNDIKVLEGKAENVELRPASIPRSTPAPLRDPIPTGRGEYLRQIEATRSQAKKDIENVISQLPPHATKEDREAIRSQAHDILNDRANITRAKVLTILDEHQPLTQDAVDKVLTSGNDRQPAKIQPIKISPEFNEVAKDDRGGGPGGSGNGGGPTPPKDHPDPPPDGSSGGGKGVTRGTPDPSGIPKARAGEPPINSKFFSQKEPTPPATEPDKAKPPKRFSRSDVSIFASPKAEAPDKSRTPDATKDATPKTAERFDKYKQSQFLSREDQAALNTARAKTRGPGRDER